MIGVDTNVLVRIFVDDDAKQTAAAQTFIRARTADDPAFVSAVVLAEVSWVLGRSYGFTVAGIHKALTWLFDSTNIVVERHDLLEASVNGAAANNADISGGIIAAIAIDAGAAHTVTFDGPASRRIPGMVLLK